MSIFPFWNFENFEIVDGEYYYYLSFFFNVNFMLLGSGHDRDVVTPLDIKTAHTLRVCVCVCVCVCIKTFVERQ